MTMDAHPAPKAPEDSPRCRFCGAEIPSGARKCRSCQAFQDWTADCVNCGSPLAPAARVCNECGSYQNPGQQCLSCKAFLPAGAHLCTKCNSPQIFRGYVNMGQVTLSLLIALISVAGSILPTLTAIVRPDRSKTSFRMEAFTGGDALQVFATNTGNKPSFLLDAKLEFGSTTRDLSIREDVKDRTILPGSTRSFLLEVSAIDASGWTRGELCKEAHVKVVIVGTREGNAAIEVMPDPSAFARFINVKSSPVGEPCAVPALAAARPLAPSALTKGRSR